MERKHYVPKPLPPAGTDFRSQWTSMQRRRESEAQPKSQAQFEQWLQDDRCETDDERKMRLVRTLAQGRKRTVDSEEEEEIFYPPTGYSSEWFFRILCRANPRRARRRVERVYWVAWQQFSYGMFLSSCGVMLLALGSVWTYYGEERVRGAGVLLAAALLCVPGFYSLFVLLMYVRGVKGYSYRQLPEN